MVVMGNFEQTRKKQEDKDDDEYKFEKQQTAPPNSLSETWRNSACFCQR